MVKVISSRTGVTVTLPALFHSAVPGNCPKTQETHKSKTFFQLRESKWEAATIVVNYTCAFPAMTSQNVRCNERSILTSCVFFCSADVFCFLPRLPQDGQTDISSVRDSWTERRRTRVFWCAICCYSPPVWFQFTHTHVHNAPANWYKPGSSRMLAAVSSSVFIQLFFLSKRTVKASYSGGRLAPKWHFCGSLSSWKLFFQRRSWLLFFYSPCQSQQSVKKLSHMMLRPSHILSSPDSSLSLLQDTCLCGFTAHFLFSSLSLLSVSCSLVQLLRVFTSLCYWSGALSSSNTPRSWLYGMFYDRLCVRCLHVCCWDVWRVLVGGTTGGEMTVNQ